MKTQHISAYERIAAAVTVRDIQRRVAFTWDVDTQGNSEADLLRHYLQTVGANSFDPVLLTANYLSETPGIDGEALPFGAYFPDLVIGPVGVGEEVSEDALRELKLCDPLDGDDPTRTQKLEINSAVSADTPLTELLESQAAKLDSSPLLVLDRGAWTGVVRRDDLMSAPARLCLLGLTLELEEAATRLCRLFPTESFAALPEGRQGKAREVLKSKYTSKFNRDLEVWERSVTALGPFVDLENGKMILAALLVDCTTFINRANMIRKCEPKLNNPDLRTVFRRAERLRNQCAHMGHDSSILHGTAVELRDLVKDIRDIIDQLHEGYDRECLARGVRPVSDD